MKHAFIHVADIHYCKDEPEGASSVLKAFAKDINKQIENLHGFEFSLAMTGDIVKVGADMSSYEEFIQDVDTLFNDIGITAEHRIVVPGNHDLDRNIVEENYSEFKKIHDNYVDSEPKFNNFMSKHNLIYDKFENYELFVSAFAKHDDSFSRLGWGYEIGNNIGVYCLNSALCSLGGYEGVNDEGRLAIYTRGLVEWCTKTSTSTNILLLHHPLDHLIDWSRDELQSIIENHFSLCLYGHNHSPAVYHNSIPHNALMCSAPPLFSSKKDTLAYSIILFENNEPAEIRFREYSNGSFSPCPRLSKTDDGSAKLNSADLHTLQQFESKLNNALESFKGQPTVFIEPILSESREFNDDSNLLNDIINSPENTLVVAPPQFGLTCLALFMRVDAYKSRRKLWIYIDAAHQKTRGVLKYIEEELQRYNKTSPDIECILIDDWDNTTQDHLNMIKVIDEKYKDIPIILLTSKTECFDRTFSLSKVGRTLKVLHLQALSRNSMRTLVSRYSLGKTVEREDEILSHMAKHMEAINIHRTALNCITLLRVLDSNYNEKVLNRTKLLKAILFVLFTDNESFSYDSKNPEVDECTYVLGQYCKDLVMKATGSFDSVEFADKLKRICKENLMTLDVDRMIDILLENNILVEYGKLYEFKHTFWIFYFAAEHMLHDENFNNYIMKDKMYVNFPEIIEFYAGIDGKREDALNTLLSDLDQLIEKVDNKIGIKGTFNPLSTFVWNPSAGFIEQTRKEIAEKIESSNLPDEIKDKHADKNYNSEAPYDQKINKFLNEYSVLSLLQSIRATSRALRNSTFVSADLKLKTAQAIFKGWEEISKVMFWISPLLAKEGKAAHDGISLVLSSGFSQDLNVRFKEVLISNPFNVATLLKDDLSSKKIGPLLCKHLEESDSEMQRHLVAIFMLEERPIDWGKCLLNHINLLHPRSFYIGNLLTSLEQEIKLGFIESSEENTLKTMVSAILAKRRYAAKISEKKRKEIPPSMMISKENEIPIDQLLSKPKSIPRKNK